MTILLVFLLLSTAVFAQETQQEQQLVNELNASRAEAGLSPLKVDDRLVQAAREHSRKMADRRTLSHVLPGEQGVAERLAATGLRFNRSGENVGYNTDFDGLHSGWMHSPPHRKNILNPDYTLVGIGVARGEDGVYWATQDFAHVTVELSGDDAADRIAQHVQALRKSPPPLTRIDKPELQSMACSMGKSGKVDPRQVLALPGVHYAVTYNNSQPDQLPDSAESAAASKLVTKFAVGACETKDAGNPGGTYYVVLAFY
jgi:hypothetical protein